MRDALVAEGGYLCNAGKKALLEKAMWDAEGHRTIETVAVSAQRIGEIAGFTVPEGRSFIMVEQDGIGP